MPIGVGAQLRRLDDREFGEAVFETMRHFLVSTTSSAGSLRRRSISAKSPFAWLGPKSRCRST